MTVVTAAPVIADKEMIRKVREIVGAAGLTLIHAAPHFGLAWAKMKPRAKVPGKTQGGTWEVDAAGELTCDGPWTLGLTSPEAVFVLAHEILHVLMGHFDRAVALGLITEDGRLVPGKEQEFDCWRIATDCAINHALTEDKVGKAPQGALFPDPAYLKTGGPIAAEPIYYWLLKQPKPPKPSGAPAAGCLSLAPPQGKGGQPDPNAPPLGPDGQPGQPPQAPGQPPQAPPDPIDWNQTRREIEAFCKQAGIGSAVAELIRPRPARTNYKSIIREGFETANNEAEERTRPTYRRLNRRPDFDGFMYPGREGMTGTVAVVIDVSGSVSRQLVAKAAGETLELARQFPNVRVIFVTHTSEVVWSGVLREGGDAKSVAEATAFTGGTAAQPAYDKVGELAGGKRGPGVVDSLVHFTDCELFEGEWPKAPARHMVIGECGESAVTGSGTPRPKGCRKIPVLE